MSIKFYLILIISTLTLTSYGCATLVSTINDMHNDRQNVYNTRAFEKSLPINTYTDNSNAILSDKNNVDVNRSASADDKEKIAKAVFGAAWADLTEEAAAAK
ncbi:MAG: hypothetical protein V4482_01540 [Pseudomonadota bacterium]